MATAELVRETSLRVAADGVTPDGVAEVLATCSGRRVALVAAKQQLTQMHEEDPSNDEVARGIELISEALRVGPWD